MVKKICLSILILSFLQEAQGQLKTKFFCLAYTAKRINSSCTEAILLENAEVELSASEVQSYGKNKSTQFNTEYTFTNGYNYSVVQLVNQNEAVIYYVTSEQKKDLINGKPCESTTIGFIKKPNMALAEQAFSDLIKQYPKTTYQEKGRWGRTKPGTDVASEYNDNIDGISINIIRQKTQAGKTNSVVKVKNNYPDKMAVVHITAEDKVIYDASVLQSGGTITIGAGDAQNINYYVTWIMPEDKTPGLLEIFKNKIKGIVTGDGLKNGIKSKNVFMPCMCIR